MKELAKTFQQSLRELGMERLVHPVFYNAPIGLRFEIGDPELPVYLKGGANPNYLKKALERTTALFHALPEAWDILRFDCFTENNKKGIRSFRAASALPASEEVVCDVYEQDRPMIESYWRIDSTAFVDRLFAAIIYADIGGNQEELTSSVHLMNTRNNVLFHLYDDRGLDIVGGDKGQLYPLFQDFNDWILDYDRERIGKIFSACT